MSGEAGGKIRVPPPQLRKEYGMGSSRMAHDVVGRQRSGAGLGFKTILQAEGLGYFPFYRLGN